jgi:hypothetical protein
MRARASLLRSLALASVGLTLPSALRAEVTRTTAAQMFELCNSPPQSQEYQVCNIYMNGFAAGVFVVLATSPSKEVCLPDYFNGDDARAVFNRFIKSEGQSPAIAKIPLNVVLWGAIADEYPCKKQ